MKNEDMYHFLEDNSHLEQMFLQWEREEEINRVFHLESVRKICRFVKSHYYARAHKFISLRGTRKGKVKPITYTGSGKDFTRTTIGEARKAHASLRKKAVSSKRKSY